MLSNVYTKYEYTTYSEKGCPNHYLSVRYAKKKVHLAYFETERQAFEISSFFIQT